MQIKGHRYSITAQTKKEVREKAKQIFAGVEIEKRLPTTVGRAMHRFRELQQFCFQYNEWKILYEKSDGWDGRGDVTSRDGIRRADLIRNITMIEECANSIDRNLLRFVTVEGSSLPPELWYQQRIFFWKLSQMRG